MKSLSYQSLDMPPYGPVGWPGNPVTGGMFIDNPPDSPGKPRQGRSATPPSSAKPHAAPPWHSSLTGIGPARHHKLALSKLASLLAMALVWSLFLCRSQAQTTPDPLQQAISREISVFVGSEPPAPYQQVISREVSVFVGAEPPIPDQQVISREISVFVGAEPEPPYRQIISREIAVFQPNGASFFLTSGQTLTLPMLRTYEVFPEWDGTRLLQASGPDTVLSLPNVTNVVGNPRRNGYLRIEALNGGRVDLSSVVTMTQPYDGSDATVPRGICVLADGTNSVVDLSGLERFDDLAATPGSSVVTRNGGTILLPKLAQLTGGVRFEAHGGSILRLPSFTDITANQSVFLAEGSGSLIDLPSLVRFYGGTMEARNGGAIQAPRLRFLDYVNFIMRDTGRITTDQIRKLTNARVTVDGAHIEFPLLFNWTGTTFSYANGGTVRMPQVNVQLSELTVNTNQLWCGDRVTVSWQGTNQTGAEVFGSWTDSIYLSADDRWDIGDILVGRVDQTNGLASNAFYSASADIFVPGVLPGNYHLLVRTFAFNMEGTNGADNSVFIPEPVFLQELVVGVPTNQTFLATAHARYYQLVASDQKDLKVSLDLLAASGATELYLRRGAIPTRSAFDIKYSAPFQPDQYVRVPGTSASTNYVLAYADILPSVPESFTLLAEYLPFALATVTPDHGGNAGDVTLKLRGSGISGSSTAKLVCPGTNGQVQEVWAIRTSCPDMEHIFAAFDLRGLNPTLADVVLIGENGQSSSLPRRLRIEPSRAQDISFNWSGPASIRVGGAAANYSVALENQGNQDLDFVHLSAWIPDASGATLKISGAIPFQNEQSSVGGAATFLLPRVMVGDQMQFTYEFAISRSFQGSTADIYWNVDRIAREDFIQLAGTELEAFRFEILMQTNLQAEAPELYSSALSAVAWQNRFVQRLRGAGFDLGVEELASVSQSPLAQSASRQPSGQPNKCDWKCEMRCWVKKRQVCESHYESRPTGLEVPSHYNVDWYGANESDVTVEQCYMRVIPECMPPPTCPKPTGSGGCGGPSPTGRAGNSNAKSLNPAQGGAAKSAKKGDCADSGSGGGTCVDVLRPRDPNAKYATEGWGMEHYISDSQIVNYAITFENQPSASAAAQVVRIYDQLSEKLDWNSLALDEIQFGGTKVRVPAGGSTFEGSIDYAGWTWDASRGWHRGETPLLVDIKAGIDAQSGVLTLTLTCKDITTGALPADPYAGFLPPNRPETFYYQTNRTGCCGVVYETNTLVQPGQGLLSYTVRPKASQATGTTISNTAGIVFDWNDPLVTPTVFNTIDADPPASYVLPLAPESGHTFLVRWAGQDGSNGSGVQSYDVYVSTDGTNFTRWLERTTDTAAYFVGGLGQTYLFYCIARDWVGHAELAPSAAQAWTTVSTDAPVLASVVNQIINVGDPLAITNLLLTGTAIGSFVFSLSDPAPVGAQLNATNGLFHWTPNCSQASQTNAVTIWVSDTGNPNILDAVTFTVAVGECVVPQLGQQVLLAGGSGRVPVNLISSVPLTNVSMTVEAPPLRIGGFGLETIVPQICSNQITPLSNAFYGMQFAACPDQWLVGTQQIAWLNFTTFSNQSSAFIHLNLDNTVGQQPDGKEVRNFAAQAGRVVVIGAEPLLEAFLNTNRQPALTLFGLPGSNYLIESAMDTQGPWRTNQPATLTNLWGELSLPGDAPQQFYRAKRF